MPSHIGPFHSSLMKVIEEDFASYINQFEWRDAKFPVIRKSKCAR